MSQLRVIRLKVGHVLAGQQVAVRLPTSVLGELVTVAHSKAHMLKRRGMKWNMVAEAVVQLDVFTEIANTFLREI